MMEVERTNERCIFLIQNQNLSYYIVIPMVKQVKILIGLMDKSDDERVKEIPLLNDKVVVIPKVNDQIINYLKTPQSSYDQAMGYFSNLINNVYGLLMHNQKEVEQVVLFNNNEEFLEFNNYFVNKVPGRVQLSDKDLLKREVVPSLNNNMMNQNVMAADIPLAYPDEGINQEEQVKGMTKTLTKKSEPGFVSYVLLGVVIAVASLIFLYMLL